METGTASYSSLGLLAKSITLTTRFEFFVCLVFVFYEYCGLFINMLIKENSFYKEGA